MPNKTPYELRFDVLQMARELVERSYDEKYHMAWSYINSINEKGGTLEAEELDRLVPQPPSAKAIKAKAAELYEFVVTN